MVVSAEGAIGVEADGYSYNIPLDVNWIDAQGSWHGHGRPECLPPADRAIGPVSFGAVDVSRDGRSWRQVVWVSCEGVPTQTSTSGEPEAGSATVRFPLLGEPGTVVEPLGGGTFDPAQVDGSHDTPCPNNEPCGP
jgi:hypothetical protein